MKIEIEHANEICSFWAKKNYSNRLYNLEQEISQI